MPTELYWTNRVFLKSWTEFQVRRIHVVEKVVLVRHFELGPVEFGSGPWPNPKQKSIWVWIKNLILYFLVKESEMYICKVFVFSNTFFYVYAFVFEEFFEKVFIFVFVFAYWKHSDFKHKIIK